MAEEKAKKAEEKGDPGKAEGKKPGESPWAGLLEGAAKTLAPVLLTGASLIGFVAFAGSVIVWTRFEAIGVPPDQAVRAVPREELVASGSSVLLPFGFFGVLAVLATYLVDRGGRSTPGMSRILLVLLGIEGLAAILTVDDRGLWPMAIAIGCWVAFVAVAFSVTYANWATRYKDDLPPRNLEDLPAKRGPGLLHRADGKPRVEDWKLIVPVTGSVLVAAHVALLAFAGLPVWARVIVWVHSIGVTVVVVLALWRVGEALKASHNEEERFAEDEAAAYAEEAWRQRVARQKARAAERRASERPLARLWAGIVRIRSAGRDEGTKAGGRGKGKPAPDEHLIRARPHRLAMRPYGVGAFTLLALAAVAVPVLALHHPWLAISIGIALVLGVGLWRIARRSKPSFMWFGLAVFLSVPLFGTFTLMARNIDDPQVHALALIRNSDGPDEAIQGIYVAEGDDRVYFANIATEGCSDELKPDSGRLLWVPRKEVVAMSIGPLQDVRDAGTSALEMAYSLTPSVETPAAGAVSLTVPEKKSKQLEKAEEARAAKEAEAHAPQLDQRLENPGPAVRPNFGSGLSLVPEIASAGETVELRLSVPNKDSGGFGPTPHGRTLRLNGVPVTVARESAAKLPEAEFVTTEKGQALSIRKREVFGVWHEGTTDQKPFLLPAENTYEGPRFVRLDDGNVSAISQGDFPGGKYSQFLRVAWKEGQPELKGEHKVTLSGETEAVPLEAGFERQAWNRDRISFEVPEHASSGVITIDCGQLAGQPLLRVAEPPTARIAVRMRPGSQRVAFDGARSRDATGGAVTERWKVGKRVVGKGSRMSLVLPPRITPYEVQLTVTDSHGKVDTAELTLLRLPASLFEFEEAVPLHPKLVEAEQQALEKAVRLHPPASIEVDGNADEPGSDSYNEDLSMRRAVNLRKALLVAKAEASSSASPAAAMPPVPVKTRALGESCPIVLGGGPQPANRRVEVFVLDPGVSVLTPSGCKAGRVEHTIW